MHLVVTEAQYVQYHKLSAVNVQLFTSFIALFETVQYSYLKLVHTVTFVRLWYVSDLSKILVMYIYEFTKTVAWKELKKLMD
jgi:hypothetical protein